jgi:Ricin-type beta-trefoil lectin domain/Spherulation-specific family 4
VRNLIRAAATSAAVVTLAALASTTSQGAVHAAAPGRLHAILSHGAAGLPGGGTHPLSIVALYAAPADSEWTTLEDSAPTVAGAIVNICDSEGNGPGCTNSDWTSKNTAWDGTVSALGSAGITPLIYLTTDDGADSIATLETELSQAKSWWGITTPMFDQMVGTEGTNSDGSGICTDGGADITCQSYYQQLYDYAMANGAQAVMFNPGTWYGMTPAFMYGPDEILQGFENSESTLEDNSAPAPSWAGSYGQFQFSATAMVPAGTQPSLATDISDATAGQHAGFVYETDSPNYSTLPSWFGTFLTGLDSASLSSPTALYEVQASQKSGYCMDNTNGSASNGNPIQLWSCLHDANQRWEYVPSVDGVSGDYQLQNSNGKCLDDPKDSTVSGTKVQLWACLGNPNQEWTAHTINGSYTEYENPNGLCLDNTGNAKTDGNRVQVWACNEDAAQQWYGPSPAS